MSILKNYITVLFLGLLLSFSKKVNAQNTLDCSYPEWTPCYPSCTWVAGDICSYDDKDWQLGSTGQNFRAPGSQIGSAYWVEISDPCTGLLKPSVEATLVRANYCTTSFGVGYISTNGGAIITARGFVYGTSGNPTLEDDLVLLDAGNTIGDEFEGLMENLTPETDYYVRTYATNSEGTTYGTQATFTTRASADCVSDCNLACDVTTPGLYNPSVAALNTTYSTIGVGDTLCITEDRTYSGNVVRGMLKVCNGATLTISGSMNVQTSENGPGFNGQIVYEGCNETINGSGAYQGDKISGTIDDVDVKQMISYCGTCDENDQSQFINLDDQNQIHLWGATCRPTSTLLLPVELISFSASLHEQGVLLEWSTGSEINNSHFEIESSYDGVNWFKIGISQGAGNSIETNNYSFIDNGAQEGSLYYRLKQVDFDRTAHYSNIKYFSFDESQKQKGFIAFQNSNDQIEIQAKFSGMGEAHLIDTRGRIVEIQTFISTNKSGTKLTFNTTDLATGVYFVKIKSGNALLGEKVQVVK
ncbi:MAG: hypothetical protein ACI9U0_001176 [Flavobacteriales bacterium]|jgi:hypothetical protein|tara:strand:- start:245 stop:1834 length:1590 start_codon:yes stop_codon:yes gene_type:complete